MNKLKKYKAFSELKFPKLTDINFSTAPRLSIKKQTFFAKRLSFLIKAGVPVLESLAVIQKQTKSKGEVRVFTRVITDLANGQTLATSLGRFKGVFSNFAVNIIKAGERSGTLTQNLSYLADELKKKELLRKKILGSLLYPIIITLATFGIAALLIVYIFPKILPIFKSLNAKLPITTRILIWLSEVFKNYGFWIFFGLVVLTIASIILIKKVKKMRFAFHGFILRIPLFGIIAKNYNLTNTMRTMGLLLKSGLSLTETLTITAETTENLQYKKALAEISAGVSRGKTISDLIEKFPVLFPEMLTHMIAIGERSGNLSNTLIYLSEYYENEFDELNKNLSSAIEPVLMIMMGVIVGFVAISVITPIYELTNSLKR